MDTQRKANESETFPFTSTFLGEIKLDPKFKVVVGIDLGTTYSGVAWIHRDNPVKVNCGAPGAKNARDETKVPTVLLRRVNKTWAFGYQALEEFRDALDECREEAADAASNRSVSNRLRDKGVALFRNFKMTLNNPAGSVDELVANSTMEKPHSLVDLMGKSLEFLSNFALQEIQKGWLSVQNVTKSDIMWVLTVPAIWNDFGKAFMRKAAHRAGMIDTEGSDHLLLALEPEAAAIAIHGEASSYGLLGKDTSFLMLDIGGGTADFTIHKVSSEKPLLLHELARPDGGPWGGIFVESEFRLFLMRFFGDEHYKKLVSAYPVEMLEIVDAFRSLKEEFDPCCEMKTASVSLGSLFSDEDILRCIGKGSLLEVVRL